MATYENKSMNRQYNPNTGEDIYTTERGIKYDLTKMRFLHAGVDTLRQLYQCNIKPGVLEGIQLHLEQNPGKPFVVGGYEFRLTKSGKRSGYQYILKNLDLGLIVLFKSFYCEADERGTHIKIEASPITIYEEGLAQLTKTFRKIGKLFGDTLEACGIAVHLAMDMKGLELPDDFEHKLATRSKRVSKVNGISDASFSAASAAFIYGRGDTYTFGNANGLQMCLYNKTLEASNEGKLNWWESIWKMTPSLDNFPECEYRDGSDGNEADTVHRLEFRIHHSVIRQFEWGNYEHHNGNLEDGEKGRDMDCIREPIDLKPHLNALWQYCLQNFRLQHSSTYVHPIWQRLTEDARFVNIDGHPDFFYKRGYQNPEKKLDGTARRNVAMWLGNFLKLSARKGMTADHVCHHLLTSGLESDIAWYFGMRLLGYEKEVWMALYEFVDDRLTEHRLNGVAAGGGSDKEAA